MSRQTHCLPPHVFFPSLHLVLIYTAIGRLQVLTHYNNTRTMGEKGLVLNYSVDFFSFVHFSELFCSCNNSKSWLWPIHWEQHGHPCITENKQDAALVTCFYLDNARKWYTIEQLGISRYQMMESSYKSMLSKCRAAMCMNEQSSVKAAGTKLHLLIWLGLLVQNSFKYGKKKKNIWPGKISLNSALALLWAAARGLSEMHCPSACKLLLICASDQLDDDDDDDKNNRPAEEQHVETFWVRQRAENHI